MSNKILIASLFFVIFLSGVAFANETSVTIDDAGMVQKGTEITIAINVSHNGNNLFHHTEWVYVKANDEEIARWAFSMFNRPDDETFTKKIKYTVAGPTEITAQGSCNIHGSAGPAVLKLNVK